MTEDKKELMPVVKTGRWRDMRGNFVEITAEDLQRLAGNYDPQRHHAPLFLDAGWHHSQDGAAAGWVEKLTVEGDLLLAEVGDAPAEVKEEVAAGRRKYVSAEVSLDDEGRPEGLFRVALLGADPPAVKGLPGLSPAMFSDGEAGQTLRVLMEFSEEENLTEDKSNGKNRGRDPAARSVKLTDPSENQPQKAEPAGSGGGDLVAELSAQVKDLTAKLAAAEGRSSRLSDQMRRSELRRFVEERVASGQLPPGFAGEELVGFMASLSDRTEEGGQTLLLSDGQEPKPVSQLAFFQAFLAGLEPIIKAGHRFTAPDGDGGQNHLDEVGDKIAQAGGQG